MTEQLTQDYCIRLLFAKHGLIGNEHFMYGLLEVCSLTGDDPEQVVSTCRKEGTLPYSRQLLCWRMEKMGYTDADIAHVLGFDAKGVRRSINKINGLKDLKAYLYIIDHTDTLLINLPKTA